MWPDLYWDWRDSWRRLRSWISQILDQVAYIRASRSWQAAGAINTTAMVEDGMRPEEKPRPPAGGQLSFQCKPELVHILAALKLNSPALRVMNS